MNPGKIAAGVIVGGVLTAQLFALSPAGRGGWYWPFVDYPMYSDTKRPGATFGLFDLEVVGCDGVTRALTAADLHLPRFLYRNTLEVAAGGRPDRPREPEEIPARRAFLGERIQDELPGSWCRARVFGRIFVVGQDGLESPDVERRLLAEWNIAEEDS